MNSIPQTDTESQETTKPTATELTLSYPIISGLLDVVLDEIERYQERIGHLQQVKARLELLIPADDMEGNDD